jgi:hypothetical protein
MQQSFVLSHSEYTQRRDRHGFSPYSRFDYFKAKEASKPAVHLYNFKRANGFLLTGLWSIFKQKLYELPIFLIQKDTTPLHLYHNCLLSMRLMLSFSQ